MLNFETVRFIGMLNRLSDAYKSKKTRFLAIRSEKDATDSIKLLCALDVLLCYDESNAAGHDGSNVFYPLIKQFKKDGGFVYYPRTYVMIDPDEDKDEKPSIFVFPNDDFNPINAVIIGGTGWSVTKDM